MKRQKITKDKEVFKGFIMQQVKKKDLSFDNLKGIGIFLVVLGHILQKFDTGTGLIIYKFIFLFHMPLFIFISGYFSKPNIKKTITHLLLPYVIIQLLEVLFSFHKVSNISFWEYLLEPRWILWYLLALSVWRFSVVLLEKIKKWLPLVLAISVIVGLIFGYLHINGEILSISRIIVLYPFFLFGYYFRQIDFKNSKIFKSKTFKIGLVFAALIGIVFFFILFSNSPKQALYHSRMYYQYENYDWLIRLYVYIVATAIILALCVVVPKRKTIMATIGGASLWIYLFHSFFNKILKNIMVLVPEDFILLYGIVLTIFVITVIMLGLKLIKYIKRQIEIKKLKK